MHHSQHRSDRFTAGRIHGGGDTSRTTPPLRATQHRSSNRRLASTAVARSAAQNVTNPQRDNRSGGGARAVLGGSGRDKALPNSTAEGFYISSEPSKYQYSTATPSILQWEKTTSTSYWDEPAGKHPRRIGNSRQRDRKTSTTIREPSSHKNEGRLCVGYSTNRLNKETTHF